MKEIKIGGRTVPMALTSYELIAIQEEIGCRIGEIRDKVFGIEVNLETDEYKFRLMDDPQLMKRFGTLIRILGNAGLEEAGEKADLTDKWVLRHMKPLEVMGFVVDVTQVINDAMHTEAAGKEEGPVDEVLEEENRKKEPGSSHTGGSAPTD